MAIKISNGDYVLKNNGEIVEVNGNEAILQRAYFRLKMKKGSFPLDQELGSELYLLKWDTETEERLYVYICEALAPISSITVTGVEKNVDLQQNKTYLTIYILINQSQAMIELNQTIIKP